MLLAVLSCFLLTSCSKESSVSVVYNTTMANQMVFCSSNEIRICIDFIYSGETPAIKVNGLSGDGLDEVNYDGKISVEDFAKTFAYRDYSLCSYIVTVDIGKKKKDDIINVDGVMLCINGKDEEIKFKEPLSYTFIDDEDNNTKDLQSDKNPTAFCGTDTVLSYGYKATTDITIKSLSINGMINIDKTKVYVNDNQIGNLSDLPIRIHKGDKIEFEVTPQIEGDESNWTNVYTNMIVNYNIDKEEYMNISELSMLPIDDEKDVKEVIDFMVK